MTTTYTTPRTLTITLKDIDGSPITDAVCYVRLVRGKAAEAALGTFPTSVTDGDFIALGELKSAATDSLGVTTMQLVPSVLLANVFYVFYVERGTFSYTCTFSMPDEDSRLEDLIAMATGVSGGGGGSIVLTANSVEPEHLDADSDAQKLAFRERIGSGTGSGAGDTFGLSERTTAGINDARQSMLPSSIIFTELTTSGGTTTDPFYDGHETGNTTSGFMLHWRTMPGIDVNSVYQNVFHKWERTDDSVVFTTLTLSAASTYTPRDRADIVGDATSGIIYGGQTLEPYIVGRPHQVIPTSSDDIYAYSISGSEITITPLTVVGGALGARLETMWIGSGSAGLVVGGKTFDRDDTLNIINLTYPSDFYSYTNDGSTLTLTPLTILGSTGISITDRNGSLIVGDANSGILQTDLDAFATYSVTGTNVTVTALTNAGASFAPYRHGGGVGDIDSGVIFSNSRQRVAFYRRVGDTIEFSAIPETRPASGYALTSDRLVVGNSMSGYLHNGMRGTSPASFYSFAINRSQVSGLETSYAVIAANITVSDIVSISTTGSRANAMTLVGSDISTDASMPTKMPLGADFDEYEENYIEFYLDSESLYARRSPNIFPRNRVRVWVVGAAAIPQGGGGSGEDNVQVNWDETDTASDAFILNKPTIPQGGGGSGEDNVQANWAEADTNSDAFILNKPTTITSDQTIKLAGVETGAEVNVGQEFTQVEKTKLGAIADGAETNVQVNWAEADTNSDAFILNKPTIPQGGGGSGEDNVQVNWDETDTNSDAFILNKPTIPQGGGGGGGITEITISNINNETQSLIPVSSMFAELTTSPAEVEIDASLMMTGDKTDALLISGSTAGSSTKYLVLSNASGTVTTTELTASGIPDNTPIRALVGDTTAGLLFSSQRVYRYAIAAGAIVFTNLTWTGDRHDLLHTTVAGDINSGLLFGGTNNSSNFTRYAATATTIEYARLTITSGSIVARNAAAIKGDGSNGFITGGYTGGSSSNSEMIQYVITGDEIALTQLTIAGIAPPGESSVRVLGDTTEGLIWSPNRAWLTHYNILGGVVITTAVVQTNTPTNFVLNSNLVVLGDIVSALWVSRDSSGHLSAEQSVADKTIAGIKLGNTAVAINISSGDVLLVMAIGGSSTLSYTFNVDDISSSSTSPTPLQTQYEGNDIFGYVSGGTLYLVRTGLFAAVNVVRVYRFTVIT